jgi:uncharacterized membrane protein (UPF0127 family)
MRTAAIAAAFVFAGAVLAQNSDLDEAFDKDVLIVHASEHACYRLDIYLAMNNKQRARGLMHVRSMPQTTGMLFVYEADGYLSIWMKNTYIPLDIVFARADGSVSSIEYDAEPLSLRSMQALEPVRYVLELNAGVAEKLSIDRYSRLEWEPKDSSE